jgi:hypothetical protein
MLPSESPFPCHWWGTSLEDVGLGDVRPRVGTYGRYEFQRLPPLLFELRGDFAWLASASVHEKNISGEKPAKNAEALSSLLASTARLGVQLPAAFIKFVETTKFHERIRSSTDCFLDVCSEPIRSPIGGGWFVRFLADSQGCIFWYLYITPNGSDHAVVASPDFYGTKAEQWEDELPDPAEIVYCAESFEAFMCRFWLENEIWYAAWKKTWMPDIGRQYIERYGGKGIDG